MFGILNKQKNRGNYAGDDSIVVAMEWSVRVWNGNEKVSVRAEVILAFGKMEIW